MNTYPLTEIIIFDARAFAQDSACWVVELLDEKRVPRSAVRFDTVQYAAKTYPGALVSEASLVMYMQSLQAALCDRLVR